MSRVFVVQRQHKLNKATGELKPKFDLSPAAEYGELVFLLHPGVRPFQPDGVVKELRENLKDYTENDYLLLIGNPALIGFAVAIAADVADGRVKLLQWSGQKRGYIPIEADLEFYLP